MNFGDYFKKLRMNAKMTLRHFCEVNGFDPGNISKLERGILSSPRSEEKLNEYASALGIKPGDDEYLTFFDLAMTSKIRANIQDCDSDILNMLPVLLRTVDKKKISPEKLERIIELIKEEIKR